MDETIKEAFGRINTLSGYRLPPGATDSILRKLVADAQARVAELERELLASDSTLQDDARRWRHIVTESKLTASEGCSLTLRFDTVDYPGEWTIQIGSVVRVHGATLDAAVDALPEADREA